MKVDIELIPTVEESVQTMLSLITNAKSGALSSEAFYDLLFRMYIPHLSSSYSSRGRSYNRGIGPASDTLIENTWKNTRQYSDEAEAVEGKLYASISYDSSRVNASLEYINRTYGLNWTISNLLSLYSLAFFSEDVSYGTERIYFKPEEFGSLLEYPGEEIKKAQKEHKDKAAKVYGYILYGLLQLTESRSFAPNGEDLWKRIFPIASTFYPTTAIPAITQTIEDIMSALVDLYVTPIIRYTRLLTNNMMYNIGEKYSQPWESCMPYLEQEVEAFDDYKCIEHNYKAILDMLFLKGLFVKILSNPKVFRGNWMDLWARYDDTSIAYMLAYDPKYLEQFVRGYLANRVSITYPVRGLLRKKEFYKKISAKETIEWLVSSGIRMESATLLQRISFICDVFDNLDDLEEIRIPFEFQTNKVSDIVTESLSLMDNHAAARKSLDCPSKKYPSVYDGFTISKPFFALVRWMHGFFGEIFKQREMDRKIKDFVDGINAAHKAFNYCSGAH